MAEMTILIPLDRSKPADLALSFLTALKPLGELRVQLQSAVESHDSVPVDEVKPRDRLVADYLAEVGERIQIDCGCEVGCISPSGLPCVAIPMTRTIHLRQGFDCD